MSLKVIDVYAAYGDYGNVGGGSLLGVFLDENRAHKAVIGRGSLDLNESNGNVVKSKAISDGEKIYLLALPFAIVPDKVLLPDPRKVQHSFKLVMSDVKDAIPFMVIVRRRTGWGLRDCKNFLDEIRNNGKAELMGNPKNLNANYSKEEAMEWRQELELNNIAKVNAL